MQEDDVAPTVIALVPEAVTVRVALRRVVVLGAVVSSRAHAVDVEVVPRQTLRRRRSDVRACRHCRHPRRKSPHEHDTVPTHTLSNIRWRNSGQATVRQRPTQRRGQRQRRRTADAISHCPWGTPRRTVLTLLVLPRVADRIQRVELSGERPARHDAEQERRRGVPPAAHWSAERKTPRVAVAGHGGASCDRCASSRASQCRGSHLLCMHV